MRGIAEAVRRRQAETETFEIPREYVSSGAPRYSLRTLIPRIISHYIDGEPEYVRASMKRCCQRDRMYQYLERRIKRLNRPLVFARAWFLLRETLTIPTANAFFASVFPIVDLTEQSGGVIRIKRQPCGVLHEFHHALELERIVRDVDFNPSFDMLSDAAKRMIRRAMHDFRIYTSPDILSGDDDANQEELRTSDTAHIPEAIRVFQIENMLFSPDNNSARFGNINSETLVAMNDALAGRWHREQYYEGVHHVAPYNTRYFIRQGVVPIVPRYNQQATHLFGATLGTWGGTTTIGSSTYLMRLAGCAVALVANIIVTQREREATPPLAR